MHRIISLVDNHDIVSWNNRRKEVHAVCISFFRTGKHISPKDVLVMAERFNKKGYHPPEVVKEGECVNCNLCEMICPDFAIFSIDSDDSEAKAG